jgi:TonB family protein
MRTRFFPVVFVVLLCFTALQAGLAQNGQISDNGRKLVRKVDPEYPDMARRANLTGTVKVYALVAPDGTVKSVEPVGGSPLLVQSSQKAILQWKFAPASGESKELVELHFHP